MSRVMPLAGDIAGDENRTPACQVGKIYSDYRIEALIAAGGVAEVYRAEHTVMKRLVAFKVVRQAARDRGDLVARMEQEARMLAEITHPNVVQIFDAGSDPEVGLYIVMELLRGHSLRELMQKSGPMLLDDAVVIAVAIAEATSALHALGICHRDIKPENVIVEPCAERRFALKLLDLGAARGAQSLAWPGFGSFGTAKYMSPEQLRGEPTSAAADQYALGHILYEMLLGRHACGDGQWAEWHLRAEPAPLTSLLPNFPRELWAVIARALAKSPRARFASMDDLAAGLREAATARAASMSPESVAWLALAKEVRAHDSGALAVGTLSGLADVIVMPHDLAPRDELDATLATADAADIELAPNTGLGLQQYASLSAEIALRPLEVAAILARYQLDGPTAKAALDQKWRDQFAADPELRQRFAELLGEYARWLASQ